MTTSGRSRTPLLDPATTFDNQPDDWFVLWCPWCLYAVTWDGPTFLSYGWSEWDGVRAEAARHDCVTVDASPEVSRG